VNVNERVEEEEEEEENNSFLVSIECFFSERIFYEEKRVCKGKVKIMCNPFWSLGIFMTSFASKDN
jgi:hypothetical protein